MIHRTNAVTRATHYTAAIVVAHLLVTIGHSLAHRKLAIGLSLPGSAFVIVVVLFLPLLALGLVWTTKKRIGLICISVSMFGSLLFGLYHHFLVVGPDCVRSQPTNVWGTAFVLTSYGLLISEAIGAYIGVHFALRETSSEAPLLED